MESNIYNYLNLKEEFDFEEIEDTPKFDEYIDETNFSTASRFSMDMESPDGSHNHIERDTQNSKIMEKTKRIVKREKAKQRAMAVDDEKIDDKHLKKMTQMIRNRISAQNSRDRKKMYVNDLEN